MKILIVSSLELPYTPTSRFTGLERIAAQFGDELTDLGHDVSIQCHKDTMTKAKILPCEGYEITRTPHAEVRAFQKWQHVYRGFDVIWDIGHLHLAARMIPTLPTVNVLNHAPNEAKYPKAEYNIVSWSKWGVSAFRRYYKQDARYQETIVVDPEVYYPPVARGNRFLTIGRMSPDKGNLNAIRLCKAMGLELDVVGGRGSEHGKDDPLTEYEKQCREECDDTHIVFRGEIEDVDKIALMKSCRALLYITGHTEITSHKVQEAGFCGAPMIIPNRGGLPEIITEGVNGYACTYEADYVNAINNVDKLEPMKAHKTLVEKYNIHKVVKDYVDLYEKVANGLRW